MSCFKKGITLNAITSMLLPIYFRPASASFRRPRFLHVGLRLGCQSERCNSHVAGRCPQIASNAKVASAKLPPRFRGLC